MQGTDVTGVNQHLSVSPGNTKCEIGLIYLVAGDQLMLNPADLFERDDTDKQGRLSQLQTGRSNCGSLLNRVGVRENRQNGCQLTLKHS
jgi:hypothetical protein